ncbi:hypothetical protein [Nitrobacter sp. TKz-YC01]|uniref:hypothetical protein n=1 Tax=Nitrobacter sp. TKz-YC01 TaxID=3398703 RepID=UPI003A101319
MLTVILKMILFSLALAGVATTGYIYYNGGLSPDTWIFQGGFPANWKNGGVHGAPGPLMGAAGLPVLLVAYGMYRLIKGGHKAD